MKKSGYKFRPSGEELLVHLIHHVAEAPLDGGEIIKGLDLYGDTSDPWTLLHESTEQDGAWYVITRVRKVGAGQSRMKRTAGCGTWKEQNSHAVPPLHYGGVEYKGLNRYFVFQPKKGSCYRREAHGHWIMNEYSLDGQDCVICEIRNKDGGRKRSPCEFESLDATKEKNKKMRMSNVVDVEPQPQHQLSVGEVESYWPMQDHEETLTTTTTHHQEQGGSDVVVSETVSLSVEEVEGWLQEDEQTLTATNHHHQQEQEKEKEKEQEQEQGGFVSSEEMEMMSSGAGDVEVTTSHHQHQDKEQGGIEVVASEAEALSAGETKGLLLEDEQTLTATHHQGEEEEQGKKVDVVVSERSSSSKVEDHLWYEDCMWMMEQMKSMDYQEWLTSLQTEIQLINTLST